MQRKEKKGFDKKKASGYIGEKRGILRRKKGGTVKSRFWIKFQKKKREWEKGVMEKIEKKKERKGKRKKKQMFCEKSCLVFRLVFGTIDTEKRKRGRKNESRNERICGVIETRIGKTNGM